MLAPAGALAHPALTPSAVNLGATARVVVEIPNERDGRATVGLTLSFAPGFTVVRALESPGWTATSGGRAASWRGGRIEGADAVDFAVELKAVAPTGTYDVALDQQYDDGRSVRTTAPITVLPALGGDATPDQHVGRAVVAGIVGVVIVVGSLVGVRLLRRRPAP